MKRIHVYDAKQSTQIDFLPVIEGDPNVPPGVMPSTPSLPLSTAGVAIVTFDLPIWLKAVDIIKQVNLNVIARLGGFHQLVLSWING